MNLFYLHRDPMVCARWHYDSHIRAMCRELAQMMSTIQRRYRVESMTDALDETLYKATHPHHPTTQWVGLSRLHYEYTYRLWTHVCMGFTYRWGTKIHATWEQLADARAGGRRPLW